MLRKSTKRPHISSSTATDSNQDVQDEETANRTATMAALGDKKMKSDKLKTLEEQVFGGETEVMEEVEKLLNKGSKATKRKKKAKKKEPAWHDEDDDQGSIQVTKAKRFDGLRKGEETKLSKSEFTQRLKTQFEKVASTPDWAKLPSEREKKEVIDGDVDEMFKKTGTFLTSFSNLPKGMIDIKPCTDINKENPTKNYIKDFSDQIDLPDKDRIMALEFHPSAQVALVGTMKNRIALFQVDGKYNPEIQSLYMEKTPVCCAHFTQDGEQVVMGTIHKSFKYFDMISGKVVFVPMKGLEETCMRNFEVSPDGKYLVFLGNYGRMNFISTKAKEWLFTLTMNGGVSSLSFSPDGRFMYSFGDEGQVYVYDLTTRDCIHRFMDEGCTQGTSIRVSTNNQYVACGSNTGVVNLYETETCLKSREPKPLKAIMNLTSSCDMLKFNATSEILAIGSRQDEKAVKLVHTSSQTVFSNFPENINPNFRAATQFDFSINSGYFAIGTNKGKALLYRLRHYENY